MKSTDLMAGLFVIVVATVGVNMYLSPKLEAADAAQQEQAATPPAVQQPLDFNANAAQLRLEGDGHYWANADVDGTFVRFMVDTGASTVALTYNDAQRIGLRPETLDYTWRIRTAGGEVFGAAITLDEVKIGRVAISDVDAMILREGLEQSLLGMSFLSQLESYEFRRGNLILRQ